MTEQRSVINGLSGEEAKAYLAALVDSSDDAIVGQRVDGVVTTWNRGAERLYGYCAEEAIGRHISFVVPAERQSELQELDERIKRGERVERLETVQLTRKGKYVHVSLTLTPIVAPDGSVAGISSIARDITEKVAMEHSLKESEQRYRTLVEMAPDAVVVHQDGCFVYANCAALGMYGARSLEQLRQSSLVDLVHPDERDAVRSRIQQLLEGEEIPLREYRLLRLTGEEISIEAASTLIDYQGRPSIQIIARDVTWRKKLDQERVKMIQELSFERSQFETVLRQMPVGVMVAEAVTGRVIHDNDTARRILGYRMQSVQGFADYDRLKIFRLDGSKLELRECPVVLALNGETVIGTELKIERDDAPPGYVSVNAAPIRNGSGRIVAGLATFSEITEKKEAEKALFDSEQRLNLALDAAQMAFCDIAMQSGTGIWSKRHFILMGYPPPQQPVAPARVGMWQERVHPEDLPRVLEELDRARRERSFFRSEHRILRADNGEALWVNVMGRFLCGESGELCRFLGVIFDVTERKEAEQALARSEQSFRLMADSMPQIAWTARPDGSLEYINAHFQLYTGIDRKDDAVARNLDRPERLIQGLVHPDDAEDAARRWREAIESGTVYEGEYRIRRADGSYRWHLSRAIPARGESGEILKWYGTATDINDQREAQELLQASEARFRWLYESNLIAIFFWRMDGRVVDANQAFCELVGQSLGECYRGEINWLAMAPPEELPRARQALAEIEERGFCKPFEKSFIRPRDAQRISVLFSAARMLGNGADGIAFAADLTELKRAERALKESELTLKLAVETTGLGIFDCDLRTGKEQWSDIAKRLFGLPPEAPVDHATFVAGLHPDDRERVVRLDEEAKRPESGGSYKAEYRTVGIEDGRERWLTARGRVYFDAEGTPLRLVGACLDITEIVQAEKALKEEITERLRAVEELHRQEQMLIRQGRFAAMGEMIGNIAHQWRQPLNTLALIVQELPVYYQRDLFSREYLEGSVARAMQVINYMSKTIDGFRNFFSPGKEKESFTVAAVVARTVSIVEAAFNELNLKIEMSLDEEIELFGSPNEFSQVVLNILVNAKDAIFSTKVAAPKVVVRLFRENDRAVLTIADNAGGVPEQIMDKIFDPYFTTKGPDKGTGIGLFMSRTIIEKNMNGSLTVRNTGEGAEFRIEV
jgi:PAS domain S-box-containing protein